MSIESSVYITISVYFDIQNHPKYSENGLSIYSCHYVVKYGFINTTYTYLFKMYVHRIFFLNFDLIV